MGRGKLRVYLGAAPGVGKTHAIWPRHRRHLTVNIQHLESENLDVLPTFLGNTKAIRLHGRQGGWRSHPLWLGLILSVGVLQTLAPGRPRTSPLCDRAQAPRRRRRRLSVLARRFASRPRETDLSNAVMPRELGEPEDQCPRSIDNEDFAGTGLRATRPFAR
jgi:hypothetical protein